MSVEGFKDRIEKIQDELGIPLQVNYIYSRVFSSRFFQNASIVALQKELGLIGVAAVKEL